MNRKLKLMGFGLIILVTVASAASAQAGNFSIGGFGGWAGSMADEAVSGFSQTKLESSAVYGGSILYRFSNGFALELCAEHLEMELTELGSNFGKLKMTPLMLLFKFQGMPQTGRGITGHFDIGGGINFTSFDKGKFVTDLEKSSGAKFTISTDNSFIFEMGGGIDYFFTKNISINLDARLLAGNVGTSWKASGRTGSVTITDIDTFHVSNFQGLVGLRFWF